MLDLISASSNLISLLPSPLAEFSFYSPIIVKSRFMTSTKAEAEK